MNTDFSKIIVVTDLDGTILDDRSEFPTLYDQLHDVVENFGANFLVATSRSPQDIIELLYDCSIDGMYAICFDGACIVEFEESSFNVKKEWTLEHDTVIETIKSMRSSEGPREIYLFGSSRAGFKIAHLGKNSQQGFDVLKKDIEINRPLENYKSIGEIREDIGLGNIRSVSWFGPTDSIEEGMSSVKKQLPDRAEILKYPEVRVNGYSWLDVVDPAVSKGRAIEYLIEKPDETYLIVWGNADNDMSMFQIADVSICPSDANTKIKQQADEVLPVDGGTPFAEYFIENSIEKTVNHKNG